MTHTSNQTQWQVRETKSVNASAINYNVTAMPEYILIGEEVDLSVKGEEVVQVTEKREMSIRKRIKLLNDEKELYDLYSEFGDEDVDLANIGNQHYISVIEDEENI